MNNITFRGKCIQDNQWAYGYYVKSFRSSNESRKHWILCGAGHNGGALLLYDRYQVNPSTIGQFSGLKDKHDKQIYEGDILKNDSGDVIECVFETNDCHSMFRFIDKSNPKKLYCNIGIFFEIISNIHEAKL